MRLHPRASVLLAAFAMLLPGTGRAAEPPPGDFDDLAQVHYKAEVPKAIRDHLRMDAGGAAGVAEIGERFAADLSAQDNLPQRRLIGAGSKGETWLVALEQGARVEPDLRLFRFDGDKLVWELNAGPWGSVLPPSFSSVIEKFVEPSSGTPSAQATRMGGVSIGMEREAVLKLLGPPRQPFGSTYPVLRYNGLEIWVNRESRVARMRSSSAAHCLGTAVCPGRPTSAAQTALGKSWWTHDATTRYPFESPSCWVDITATGEGSLSGATIAAIDVVCEAQR